MNLHTRPLYAPEGPGLFPIVDAVGSWQPVGRAAPRLRLPPPLAGVPTRRSRSSHPFPTSRLRPLLAPRARCSTWLYRPLAIVRQAGLLLAGPEVALATMVVAIGPNKNMLKDMLHRGRRPRSGTVETESKHASARRKETLPPAPRWVRPVSWKIHVPSTRG